MMDSAYDACVRPGLERYCKCAVEKYSNSLTIAETHEVKNEIIANNYDVTTLQSKAGLEYIKIGQSCAYLVD